MITLSTRRFTRDVHGLTRGFVVVAEVYRNSFTAAEKKRKKKFLPPSCTNAGKRSSLSTRILLEVCQTPETNQPVGPRSGFSSGATSSRTLGRKEDSEKATRPPQEIRRTFFFFFLLTFV